MIEFNKLIAAAFILAGIGALLFAGYVWAFDNGYEKGKKQ